MKKLLCITVALAMLLLFGCNYGGEAVQNAEFRAYADELISVMLDIGVIESPPAEQSLSLSSRRLLSGGDNTFSGNAADIFSLLSLVEGEPTDATSDFVDVFEQTFYVPLIMGEALSEYYGVRTFYGVCAANPWGQYVSTERVGREKTTLVYTPSECGVFDEDTYLSMTLDYTDSDEYRVSAVQLSADYQSLLYFYLNVNGDFLSYSFDADNSANCYITWGRSFADAKTVTDADALSSVGDMIRGEFDAIELDRISALKTSSRYEVDEEKWNAAQAKYLPDAGKHDSSPYMWADEECTVLAGIVCRENIDTLVIPAEAKYILDRFTVQDEGGRAANLFVPNTLLGVKSYERIDAVTTSDRLIDADPSKLVIHTTWLEPFEHIIVEDSSPIFRGGTGHLTLTDGEIVAYVNAPHPTGVIDAFELVRRNDPFVLEIERYPLLCESINTVVYENTDGGVDGDVDIILSKLNFVRRLYYTSPSGGAVNISFHSELEIVIDAPGMISVYAQVEADQNDKEALFEKRLTVTLKRADCTLGVFTNIPEENITLNLPWSEGYYNLKNGMIEPLVFGVNADAVNKSFSPDEEELNLTGITIELLHDKNLKAMLDATVRESFVIPESYYGYRFTEIYLWNDTDRDIEITVPSTVTDFSVGSVFGIGSNVTVNYSGSLSEFEGIVSAYKSVTKFAHYLICDDFKGYYKSSVIEVSFGEKTYFALVGEFMEGYRFSLYTTDLITDYREGVYRYYYTDQFGREYTVIAPGYSERHIFGDFETEADICDLILTYHEQLSPPDDMPTQGEK